MRGVEFSSLLSCICGEVADKEFIYVTENVVVLASVCRDVLDKFDETLERLCLSCRTLSQLAESLAECLEDAVVDILEVVAHEAVKTAERIAQYFNTEFSILKPSIEKVLILDEESDSVLAFLDKSCKIRICVVFHNLRKVFLLHAEFLQTLDFCV